MARRNPNVFSLAFLDAITCGFGAVILFYMVINAAVGLRAGKLTGDLSGEVDRLETEVLEGTKNLVELRNAVRVLDQQEVDAAGLARRLLEMILEIEEELATFDAETLASRESLNKLKTDLKSLEESTKRLSASLPSDETPGDRLRSFVGDGDRQYLTGLKVGGDRILILVDSSASMLGETIVNIIRLRNLPPERKIRAAKWRRTVDTVDWLAAQLPRDSRFQIYAFDESARPVLADSDGRWLDGGDREELDRAVAAVRALVPGKGTNLERAFDVIHRLTPRPDNVVLLTDGLPTQGSSSKARRGTVTAPQRLKLFNRSTQKLPRGLPINVILLPIEGDPMAASAFWKLALATSGSMLSPPDDWP